MTHWYHLQKTKTAAAALALMLVSSSLDICKSPDFVECFSDHFGSSHPENPETV